uniref:Serine/threonine-protein kinase RIO3 n=1 Tax=Aceria tosichella TaxID=561515 RepID=A0A6G1S9J9_9ACAR
MDSLASSSTNEQVPHCSSSNNAIGPNATVETNDLDLIDQDARLAAQLAEDEVKQSRDCASDAALALILQRQFDLDYNNQLKKQEERLNGQSKVGVSLDKFRRTSHAALDQDQDDLYQDALENDIDSEVAAWDAFDQSDFKRRSDLMGRLPYFMDEKGNMVTKHDIPTSNRKNMCRLMELKTDLETGDAGSSKDDFKISNCVYNHLKVHSKKSARRANQRLFMKKERENAAILEDIQAVKMSDATRAIMDGLLIAFKIEKLNGVIGHGKESTVLHATGRDHEDKPGQEVAIKIFKSDNNMAFKTRDTYNKSKCPSYKFDKPKSKNDSLNKWAERGYKNLKLLRKADIDCPDAISLKKHVLVMTFLGSNCQPAPQLKDANLDLIKLQSSYEQVIVIMMKMYSQCDLIHGDLSEYNLMWYNEKVFVIDVSQSMSTSHPNANSFLYRDCKNMITFYRKSGLIDILDEKELFKQVSGKDLNEKDVELWSKIEDFPSNEKLMQKDRDLNGHFGRSDNFEHMLDSVARNEFPSELVDEQKAQ